MRICKYDLFFALIVLSVLSVFAYFGWQDVDIQFLGFTSGDELPQFKQLNNVLEGYLSLDLEKMFRIEFYNYGYIYYLLNVLVTAPFNLVEKYDWAIFAPRFVNGVFSVLNLWMVYKIANLYLAKNRSLLLVIFCLLIPGFWHYGYIFKPDVFQAFFVLCSVYFLCLDNFAYKKNFYLSVLMLGLGIGVAKFQAIMFAPLLCIYVFIPFLNKPTLKGFWQGCWKSFVVVLCLLLIWIVTNPYLLHPTGMKVWWNMFVFNMQSNATNHGSYTHISLVEKIWMENRFFLSIPIILFLSISFIVKIYKKRQYDNVWFCVFITFCISLAYLLLLVNKTWGSYYVSTIYLALLLLIPFFKRRQWLIGLLFALQVVNIFCSQSIEYFAKRKTQTNETIQKSNEIVDVLKGNIDNTNVRIYIDNPNFSYHQLGLTYKNVYQLFGTLLPYIINKEEFIKKYPYKNPSKYFVQYDLIIISREMINRNQQMSSIDQDARISQATIENISQYGYQKIAESKNFLFFKYVR
ncbi:glycosyltransferase family 39 protein [uncultured Helicobacter sp.]|uniref:ArnT family glycosyltransferase n=1 Tax=uncultured Helicobacter sp. TaxID=175537 RepID=UPI002620682B|nr:glycosyltransferase family 39 protein [uncultured Helicobacter sp.]